MFRRKQKLEKEQKVDTKEGVEAVVTASSNNQTLVNKKGDKKDKKEEDVTNSMSNVGGGNIGGNLKGQKNKPDKNTSAKHKFSRRAVFFGVINLLAIVFLLILQSELPKKALELKTLINAGIRAEASSKVNYTDLELESNKELIGKISKLFPDDNGLVDFIKTMENIKLGGVLINFSFASKEPVRDKTGNLGIPVIAQFKGGWEQIDTELQKIQKAPYLFRPITVEVNTLPEENMIELMYGGFLYVDESL